MRRNLLYLACICLFLVRLAGAQTSSTPEERARFVAITHKLESNPLDASLHSEREWALKWLIQVPDIHVSLCPSVLGDYFKYKYSSEITAQLSFGSAAFVIENPDKAGDTAAQYLAGVESALKSYTAMLQQKPRDKSKVLDGVLDKQAHGQLKAYVEESAAKGCK